MNGNALWFVIFPYAAVVLCVGVSVLRAVQRPSTLTSRTSQLLEHRKLLWGSVPFHWGLLLVLGFHLLALLVPRGVEVWNAVPLRLFLLEATGLALALWALGGLAILLWRRSFDPRIRVVTTPMDQVVLWFLTVSIVTGILTAVLYRYGSFWFPSVFTPYLWSLLTLRPRPELVADLPWVVKLHVLAFFALLAVFPFSRLVHLLPVPLGYLTRPWQVVLWTRRPGEAAGPRR
ncbi:MAG: respiratory nitrate reductase subunit gamma [Deferrisomatales bacterium]|nr:respiratory nitrate reductase subunit gamma [Deferrisomatales bacterium]